MKILEFDKFYNLQLLNKIHPHPAQFLSKAKVIGYLTFFKLPFFGGC